MSDYSIALQRLIERFCRGDISTLNREDSPHHYDMLKRELERIEELEARSDNPHLPAELVEDLRAWATTIQLTIENRNRLEWQELIALENRLREVLAMIDGEKE